MDVQDVLAAGRLCRGGGEVNLGRAGKDVLACLATQPGDSHMLVSIDLCIDMESLQSLGESCRLTMQQWHESEVPLIEILQSRHT